MAGQLTQAEVAATVASFDASNGGHLYLEGSPDFDLTKLAKLEGLIDLQIDESDVVDLSPLQNLKALTTLNLNGTDCDDYTVLGKIQSLESLALGDTGISDFSFLKHLTNLRKLYLHGTELSDLSKIESLPALEILNISSTKVVDISPLSEAKNLHSLFMDHSLITKLEPLSGLGGLVDLSLIGCDVVDLRPIQNLGNLILEHTNEPNPFGENKAIGDYGLQFRGCAACEVDGTIAEIAEIEGNAARAEALFDHLKHWTPPASVQSQTDQSSEPSTPLTVAAVLDAQDQTGMRFSPAHGALELFVIGGDLTAQQQKLVPLVRDRLQELLEKLRNGNALAMRGDTLSEAERFQALLSEDAQELTQNALGLWASLIALGGVLEANDVGLEQGRDPLDCLKVEDRTALQTFLAVASGLVRAFPDTKDLDDAYTGFNRTGVSAATLSRMLDAARDQGILSRDSAELTGSVATLAQGEGTQASKAHAVTRTTVGNMTKLAALFSGGIATGAGVAVGGEVAAHFEFPDMVIGLAEKSIEYLDSMGEELSELINGMPPDEKANMISLLKDLEARRLARD